MFYDTGNCFSLARVMVEHIFKGVIVTDPLGHCCRKCLFSYLFVLKSSSQSKSVYYIILISIAFAIFHYETHKMLLIFLLV